MATRPDAMPKNKKRLSDDALNALASRMATERRPVSAASRSQTTAALASASATDQDTRTREQMMADKAARDRAGAGQPRSSSPVPGARPNFGGIADVNAPASTTMPPASTTGSRSKNESSLDYLSRLRAEQDRVTEATRADLAAGKAKASLDAGARAGAAGMGLSGATAALKSDIGRQQDRGAVLALDELARRQADQEFQAIGQQAAIVDYEDAYDLDMDGDGMIGGEKVGGKIGDGDPENDPKQKPKDAEDIDRALTEAKALLSTDDLYTGDPDNGPGSKQQPYAFKNMAALVKWFRDTTGAEPEFSSEDYGGTLVIQDQYGNWYTLTENNGGDVFGIYFG